MWLQPIDSYRLRDLPVPFCIDVYPMRDVVDLSWNSGRFVSKDLTDFNNLNGASLQCSDFSPWCLICFSCDQSSIKSIDLINFDSFHPSILQFGSKDLAPLQCLNNDGRARTRFQTRDWYNTNMWPIICPLPYSIPFRSLCTSLIHVTCTKAFTSAHASGHEGFPFCMPAEIFPCKCKNIHATLFRISEPVWK